MSKSKAQADAQNRRQLARQAQQQALAAARRRRRLVQLGIIGGVAVVVVAIVASAVFFGLRGRPDSSAAPAVSTTVTVGGAQVPLAIDGSAVRVGPADAKATMDLWVDYSCPHCQEFEAENNATINGLIAAGNFAVRYHNIQIVTDYGTAAGSAAACVAVHDPAQWPAFNAALYANHSATTDSWKASDFTTFAAAQGIGDASQQCIAASTYEGWIGANTSASAEADVSGTPTMFFNGTKSDTLTGAALTAKVQSLVAA